MNGEKVQKREVIRQEMWTNVDLCRVVGKIKSKSPWHCDRRVKKTSLPHIQWMGTAWAKSKEGRLGQRDTGSYLGSGSLLIEF